MLLLRLISDYRSRRGIGGEMVASGGAGKAKDTSQCEEDVLLCRGLLHEVLTLFEVEKGCSG